MLANVAPALGVVELLLVAIPQHLVHHSAASPHVKHGLSVLVAHLLQQRHVSASAHSQTTGVKLK